MLAWVAQVPSDPPRPPALPAHTAASPGPHPATQVAALGPQDVLPPDLMHRFYHDCYALLRSGRYADRIAPFLRHFKREK